MKKNIVIIGSGQIGTRHLQAIKKIKNFNNNVFVIDNNKSCLDFAKKRFNEIKINNPNLNVYYLDSYRKLPNKIHLLIISTTSNERYLATKKMIMNFKIKYIIFEKILFNNISQIKKIHRLIIKNKITAWVNCNHQSIPQLKKFKNDFCDKNKKIIRIYGEKWSFASSCIHYIDFFTYFCSSPIQSMQYQLLNEKVIPSHRKGYYEFGGMLTATTKNNDILILESYKDLPHPLCLNIMAGKATLFIEYITNKINITTYGRVSAALRTRKQLTSITSKFLMPQQSDMTTQIVKDIFEKNRCDLPRYHSSSKNHILMLKTFAKKLNKFKVYKNNTLLIT